MCAEAFDDAHILVVEGPGLVRVEVEDSEKAVANEERRADDRLVLPVARLEFGKNPRESFMGDQPRLLDGTAGLLIQKTVLQLQAELLDVVFGEPAR